jgi:surface protein
MSVCFTGQHTVNTMLGVPYEAATFGQDTSSRDTTNVADMSYMFYVATTYNQRISSWDTANVAKRGCVSRGNTHFNQATSSCDTANAACMSWMLTLATSFNQDISSWDTANVANMSFMFGKLQAPMGTFRVVTQPMLAK